MDIEDFYIPNDKLTTRYEKAVEKLEHLPASFYLPTEDNPDSQGTPDLELKKTLIKPIKNIPLYSKLLDGSSPLPSPTSFLRDDFPSLPSSHPPSSVLPPSLPRVSFSLPAPPCPLSFCSYFI